MDIEHQPGDPKHEISSLSYDDDTSYQLNEVPVIGYEQHPTRAVSDLRTTARGTMFSSSFLAPFFVFCLLLGGFALMILWIMHDNANYAASQQGTSVSLDSIGNKARSALPEDQSVTISGDLSVDGEFVLTPILQPTKPKLGNIYIDKSDARLYYYDGTSYQSLLNSSTALNYAQLQSATNPSPQQGNMAINGSLNVATLAGITIQGTNINGNTITGTNIVGSGANITNLNASSITTGTIASDRLPGLGKLQCPAGIGNLSGGGNTATLGGTGCNPITITDSPSFSGDLVVVGNTTLGSPGRRLSVNSSIMGSSPLVLQGAIDDAYTTTVALVEPTQDNIITLPNESGTVCLQASVNCGFLATATSGNFVNIGPATAQEDSSTNSSIFLNKTGASGNLLQLQSGAVDVLTLSNEGQAILRNTLDSVNAFDVQTAAGISLLRVDTASAKLALNNSLGGIVLNADTATNSLTLGNTTTNRLFANNVDYATGDNANMTATGDVNADGIQDVVVCNYTLGTISVLMGNGDGTLAAKVDYAVSSSLRGVAVADLNNDGKPDIIATEYADGLVAVLLNNGDGTFASKTTYAVGTNPYRVKAADFNKDGKTDLAVTNFTSNNISVLLNNGDGTFAPQVTYASTGTSPEALDVADFNGDGAIDIAVGNNLLSNTSVFMNNGSGGFLAAVTYTSDSRTIGLIAKDVNGDGKPDIITIHSTKNRFRVAMNNGTGTFATGVAYAVGSNPTGIDVADYNGDGKQDVGVVNYVSQTISILLNKGDGTYGTRQDTVIPAGYNTIEIRSADLNNDGKLDLITANNANASISVYTNNRLAANTAKPANITITANGNGADVLRVTNANTGTDVLRVDSTGSTTIGGRASLFDSRIDIAGAGTLRSIGDFNGDKLPDFVTSDYSLDKFKIFMNAGSGNFALPNEYASTYPLCSVATDFNNDGKTDIVFCDNGFAGVRAYTNNGDGTFNPVGQFYSTGANPIDIKAGDFNNDGKPDLAVSNFNADTVTVLLNTGGSFGGRVNYPTGTLPQTIGLADFNNDGYTDIVNVAGDNYAHTFINKGDGTFNAGLTSVIASAPRGVVVADFNNDGKQDWAAGTNGSGRVDVNVGNGDGTFIDKGYYLLGSGSTSLVAGDFNNDGKIDLVSNAASKKALVLFLNNGDATFAAGVDIVTPTSVGYMSMSDFNSDGKADIVAATSNGVSVYMNSNNRLMVIDGVSGGSLFGVSSAGTAALNGSLVVSGYLGAGGSDRVIINSNSSTERSAIKFANGGAAAPSAALATSSIGDKIVLYEAAGNKQAIGIDATSLWLQSKDGVKIYDSSAVQKANIAIGAGNNFFATGNFGVGTVLPQNKLSVESLRTSAGTVTTDGTVNIVGTGTTFAAGIEGSIIYITANGTTYTRKIVTRTSNLLITVDSAVPAAASATFTVNYAGLQMSSTGNVGIGNIAPTYLLHVGSTSVTTGTAVARFENAGGTCTVTPSTAGGITCTSDIRLKKDITGYSSSDALNKLLGLNTISYHMNTEQSTDLLHTGFSAQDLEQTMPDLVVTDNEGYKSISYSGLTPYIVSAIQEQQRQLTQTKQAVSAVQGAIGIDSTTNATFASLNISGQTTLKALTVTDDATFTGTVTVKNLVVDTLTINGHIITAGNTPAVTIGLAAGSADETNNIPAPIVTIDGNDTAGTITIVAGAHTTIGDLAELTFTKPFAKPPRVMLTAGNENTANLRFYRVANTDKVRISLSQVPEAQKTYVFDYLVAQ